MNRSRSAVVREPVRIWRRSTGAVSLPEVHRSVVVPVTASFWRKLMAFSGPGFLVAVGYMDPGNWATDLAGGGWPHYLLARDACVISANQRLSLHRGDRHNAHRNHR